MKKTYRSLTTCARWAVLVGLMIATGPAIGFGQDVNELAAKVANEVAAEPANEAASEPAKEVAAEAETEVAGEAANESQATWSAYGIITQRNMFSKNRQPPRRAAERPTAVRRDPNPESYYIFRGVVRENDTFIAFLQDNQQGGVLQLREGDKVARGTVKSLTLDSIEYEFEGKTTAVAFGQDLEGGQGALDLNDMSGWSTAGYSASPRRDRNSGGGRRGDRTGSDTSSPPSSVEPLTGDAAELLQKLMERRQQQLGR